MVEQNRERVARAEPSRGASDAAQPNCECHDCTQARYRSSFQGQIDQSRGMVAEVKKRNPEWSEILEQAVAPYRKRVETLEAGHVVLLEALRRAQQAFAAYDATMAILEQRLVNGKAVDDATQRLHKSIAANAANLRKEFNTRSGHDD